MSAPHEMVVIVDFGSQYTQLIARRVRELGVYCEVVPFHAGPDAIRSRRPKGILLSGGPDSVYADGAPSVDRQVFDGRSRPRDLLQDAAHDGEAGR
jgi:GMP synthase (glutamine-hydrolysing)